MTDSRTWFVTSTTYGTWLPGDERGFVGRVRDLRPGEDSLTRVEHDRRGDDYDADLAAIKNSALNAMRGNAVWLTAGQATAVRDQLLATAAYRGWQVHAVAVMANHFHIVATTGPAVAPDDVLRDFKCYASRALNKAWARPRSGTWWTESGSCRELPGAAVVRQKVRYTLDQEFPLALYASPDWLDALASGGEELVH